MNDTLMFILIVGAVVAGIALIAFLQRRKKISNVVNQLPVTIPDSLPYVANRPGVFIQSVVPIPETAADAIANGIEAQKTRITAAHPTWIHPEPYNVILIEPQAMNYDGSPALLIRGIQSAGTCIGVGNDGFSPPIIVLPHQRATEWAHLTYLMASAWHESEHVREFINSPEVFYFFLNANDIHPHFP